MKRKRISHLISCVTLSVLVVVSILTLSGCIPPPGRNANSQKESETELPPLPTQPILSDSTTDDFANPAPNEVLASPDSILPHPLYYLSFDQLHRMERDGKTITRLTYEPIIVKDYDVSKVDGTIAYLSNNQLWLMNSDGSDKRILVDGGPPEDCDLLSNPAFSPDGLILAYGYDGLTFYDLSSGVYTLVIKDQYISPDDCKIPIEIYSPEEFSPDGTKLLLAIGHWEVLPTNGVYDLINETLVYYKEVADYIYCCSFHGGPVWSPDSKSFFGIASIHDTSYLFGDLWQVNAESGDVTRYFPPYESKGTALRPVEPFIANDGQLYFFFGSYDMDSGYLAPPVLNLVRSSPDDLTNQAVLRNENFVLMVEALWAPDASLVIVASSPYLGWSNSQKGGVLELYYTDGQQDSIWLAPLGYQLKWGP